MGTIYISTRQSEEHRIVIVKDGSLLGFEQDIVGWENRKGDIYKAVVTRIEEGLDAAFVNFGESKNGFLPLKHVAADLPGASGGEHGLAEGDSILVQIKKDHVGDKGAGMTTSISLAGSYLVLMPNTKKDSPMVSKHIVGRERRKAAESLAGLVPDGMSVIVRSAGVGRPTEDLRWDLECYLLKLWRAVESAAQNNRGPLLIYRENNLMLRAVRDYYRPGRDEIYCDDAESYREMKGFMELISPDNADSVRYHDGGGAMVPDEIERQIDEIYKREIKTDSGARVVFDVTEAMVAVDVNSAQMRGHADIEATALRANMEAADVVARHLRLRDISGLIVVDFIDMTTEENRRKLEEHVIGLVRKDRARIQWTPLSRFGLMEFSRQRLSRPVEESQSIVCHTCRGTGRQRRPESFALRLLRQIRGMLPDETVGALVMQAPADAAVYLLNEKRVELRRMEDEYNCEILIAPLADMHPPDFTIRKIKKEGRVGVSYQAKGGGEDKIRAEEMRRRFEKRAAGSKTALIQTVMPEERAADAEPEAPKDGFLGRIWKTMRGMFRGDSAENRRAPAKRGGKRRAASDRRPHRRGDAARNSARKKSADADSSAATESSGGGKRTRGGKRRRPARRLKQESEATSVLHSDVKSALMKQAASADPGAAAVSPAESAASSSAGFPDVSPIVGAKSPAAAPPAAAPIVGASEISAETANVAKSAESAQSAAADDGEDNIPLETRLARRYDNKSEAEIRAALAAIGAAGAECFGEIPPQLTARLDAYFTPDLPALDSPAAQLHKVEIADESGDDAPAEFQHQVHELAAKKSADGENKSADQPIAADSAPLRQVETIADDRR